MVHGFAGLLALHPASIAGRLELWRLVTWPLVQGDPISLLFVGLMLVWIGAQLSYEWSERALLARMLWIVLGAGLVTTAAGLVWAPADVPYAGAWPLANALLFTWAMLHPDAEMRWFFAISTSGKVVALVLAVGTVLYGVYLGGLRGIGAMVPHLSALGISWALLQRRTSVRRPWLRARQRWYEWQARRRARHLRVVRKNGSDERGRWLN
ncbi:MAG TPA: rhomboid family intramembrane serine protease [Anaeromyxobacteraceae bacterium]|nr:rhomboid family intramembrane serine protease [Anaeromyxobacteraceae bacterium]